MRKFFKWLGIIVLSLIIIVVVIVLFLVNKYNNMSKVTYETNPATIVIPTDSASLARGASLAASVCSTCHGGDFAGTEFFNDPTLGTIPAPNITRGGRTKNYSDEDYVRTIRYGVKPDKHGLFIMPVEDFNYMSDEDLGSLIAYIKSVPVSDKTWPDPNFKLTAKIMAGAGLFGTLYHAEELDLQDNKPKTAPEPGPTVEYGKYTMLIHGCWTCHSKTLNGGITPDPASPPAENITPGGYLGKWSLEQFKETLRTGKTPEGEELNSDFMPWDGLGLMTDLELEALYNYLKSLPALEDADDLKKYNEKHKEE